MNRDFPNPHKKTTCCGNIRFDRARIRFAISWSTPVQQVSYGISKCLFPRKSGALLLQSRFEATLNSSRKRSDIDIMACILGEARKDARKTHIMYKCNLSYRQLQVYLKLLLGMKLLKSHSNVYKTTVKGLFFLDEYRNPKDLMT